MGKEIKTLDGVMNLDDANEIIASTHHKEARNGVFRGNQGLMKFQAIRGNIKVTNGNLKTNDRP
jgi:hypothetical protein